MQSGCIWDFPDVFVNAKKPGRAPDCRKSLVYKELRQKKVQNKFFEKTQILILGGHMVNVKRFPQHPFDTVKTEVKKTFP